MWTHCFCCACIRSCIYVDTLLLLCLYKVVHICGHIAFAVLLYKVVHICGHIASVH